MWLWDRKGLPRIIGVQRELGTTRVHTVFEMNKLLREDKERWTQWDIENEVSNITGLIGLGNPEKMSSGTVWRSMGRHK